MVYPRKMKLYTHPISLFPFRVKIALHEKGLVYEEVVTDLVGGASEEFLKLNPFAQIPVLDDEGFVMAESMAILEYLEEKFPKPALSPADVESRATMRKLMGWSTDYWYAHWKAWLAPRLGAQAPPWNEESVAEGHLGLTRHLDVIGEQLGNGEWLVGSYSMGDICYAPLILSASRLGLEEEIEARPKVQGWLDRLVKREAVREALLL
jgi:glutathione S-transferase